MFSRADGFPGGWPGQGVVWALGVTMLCSVGCGPNGSGDPPRGEPDAGLCDDGPPPPFGPRPFYVFGHNPNTMEDVTSALRGGANALEPDVNVYSHDHNRLCISHGEGGRDTITLVDYLDALHGVALAHPELALVVFDCKEGTVSSAHGRTLLDAIRAHLTHDTGISVILSVGELKHMTMFDEIAPLLGDREGLMVDYDNSPDAVSKSFSDRGVVNQGYGNGISFLNTITALSPNVRLSMERASVLRAGTGLPRFTYVWTVNEHAKQREEIRIGVDGIISDDVAGLTAVVREPEFVPLVRMATRADNPFKPPNQNYGLTVHTGRESCGGIFAWACGGTDAHVTFTLTGESGSRSVTVDTSLKGHMEDGDTNSVTLQSPDLGRLTSLTVKRDNDGAGPDWWLDSVDIRSDLYGVAVTADFHHREIEHAGEAYSVSLPAQGTQCRTRGDCPANHTCDAMGRCVPGMVHPCPPPAMMASSSSYFSSSSSESATSSAGPSSSLGAGSASSASASSSSISSSSSSSMGASVQSSSAGASSRGTSSASSGPNSGTSGSASSGSSSASSNGYETLIIAGPANIDDNEIRLRNPDFNMLTDSANCGAARRATVGTQNWFNWSNQRLLVRADLSMLPPHTGPVHAVLRILVTDTCFSTDTQCGTYQGSTTFTLYPLLRAWGEGAGDCTTAAATGESDWRAYDEPMGLWGAPGASLVADAMTPNADHEAMGVPVVLSGQISGLVEWDVSDYVNSVSTGERVNNGWILMTDGDPQSYGNHRYFNMVTSEEVSAPGPQLVVSYVPQ